LPHHPGGSVSFHFEFVAATPRTARAVLATQHAPDAVKALVERALDELTAHHAGGLVAVRATGHLCVGPQSYEHSHVEIDVRPLQIARPPSDDTLGGDFTVLPHG
jgi:hypothetical protein